jgi:hypothetical protein
MYGCNRCIIDVIYKTYKLVHFVFQTYVLQTLDHAEESRGFAIANQTRIPASFNTSSKPPLHCLSKMNVTFYSAK